MTERRTAAGRLVAVAAVVVSIAAVAVESALAELARLGLSVGEFAALCVVGASPWLAWRALRWVVRQPWRGQAARMLFWLVLAAVAAALLVSPAVGVLDAAVRAFAEVVLTLPSMVSDPVKLAAGVVVVVLMWRWTTPKSGGFRNPRKSPYRRR